MSLSDLINVHEQVAVKVALNTGRMPTPKGDEWDAIVKHYNLPKPKSVDKVLSEVQLPPGWTISADPDDPYGRNCIIYDHEKVSVGGTFLKNSLYDYYGFTHFKKDRLQELGIMSD